AWAGEERARSRWFATQGSAGADRAGLREAVARFGGCYRTGDQLAAPPARVWCDFVAISPVRVDPAGVRRRSGRDAGAAGQPATRWSAQAPSLVLGQRVHEPLFRVGGVNNGA